MEHYGQRWRMDCSPRGHGELGLGSIDSEAVEQARAAGTYQIVLAAAPRRVGGVPGMVPAACAIGVSNLSAARAIAGPIVASVVLVIGVGASIRL